MSFFVGILYKSENKKAHFLGFGDIAGWANFAIVSRRQNMSFFLQLSLKRYYKLTTGTNKNELQSLYRLAVGGNTNADGDAVASCPREAPQVR